MKKLLLSALFSYCIVAAFAQTSTSVPNVVNPGISADKWSVITVVNAQRIDGKYIESKIMKGGGAIIFFRDFRFAVPSSATVKGIDVRVTRKKKGMNEVKDITVALLKPINDTEATGKGPNLAKTEPWSEQLATVLYEFPDTAVDANGQKFYWSAKEINHPAFGLFLNPSVGAGKGASLLIDQVELTVKYTLPTTRQLQFQSVDKIIKIKNENLTQNEI